MEECAKDQRERGEVCEVGGSDFILCGQHARSVEWLRSAFSSIGKVVGTFIPCFNVAEMIFVALSKSCRKLSTVRRPAKV